MSQIPPGSGDGWVDPYGTSRPGSPPPGYWLASDGRWYPPDAVSADANQAVPSTEPEPSFPGPSAGPGAGSAGGFQPPEPSPFTPPSPGTPPGPSGPSQGVSPSPGGTPGYGGPGPSGPPGYGGPGPGFGGPGPSGPPGLGGPAPVGAPSPYGGPGGYGPPPGPSSSGGGSGGRTLLIVLLVVGALIVLCVGGVALSIARTADEVSEAVDDLTTSTPASSDGTTGSDSGGETATTSASPSGDLADTADALGCTFAAAEEIEIEMVNTSSETRTYFLTVAFLEGTDRLGDTTVFINNLRAGQRTIERSSVFDQEGSTCEIVAVDDIEVDETQNRLDDAEPCQLTGADFAGDAMGEVGVTNSSEVVSDYSVDVALIDADGIRRGTGFSFIDAVRPGERAPGDLFSFVEDQPGLTCEVINVRRTDSE